MSERGALPGFPKRSALKKNTVTIKPFVLHGTKELDGVSTEIHLHEEHAHSSRGAFLWVLRAGSDGAVGEEPALLKEHFSHLHYATTRQRAHPFAQDALLEL